jgi:glycosyltransferase involved in cell wall biosynthesis
LLKKNKKLIYILNSYSKDESSHFFHVMNLLAKLALRGIDIVLLIEKANDIPEFEQSNIKVICLNKTMGIKRFIELYQVVAKLNREGFNRTYIRIASVTALIASIANKLNGGCTYFWQSGTTIEWDLAQPFNLKKIKWYLTSYLMGKAARAAVDYFVTGPESMVKYYEKVANVAPEKIKLLYNDIDVERFSKNEHDNVQSKKDFMIDKGFSEDALILLLVHRLSPVRKTMMYFPACLDVLIEKKLLSKVVVIIAGGGPDLQPIKDLTSISNASKHCLFLGDIANHEIQNLYKISDIFLHPTYNEGFPRVILEAMAASLPIISTDAGGTRELVGHEQNKFISSKDDTSTFFNNLTSLIESSESRKTLAVENRKHVEKFSTENIAQMYEEVLFDEKN